MLLQTLRVDTDAFPAAARDDEAAEALAETPASEHAPASTPAPTSQTVLAFLDVVEGARASYLWGLLGWQDIRQRYRRSKIGPFWLTISMGMLVAVLGVLYASLFKIEIADFLPYIALGFIVWGLVSGLINEGCTAFVDAESIIKQVSLRP